MTARPAFDAEYHAARLLLLLEALTRRRARFDGLTKLAKLDFLLRYPMLLGQLLERDGLSWTEDARPTEVEQGAVESRMIRYKYGPWDDAYYSIIGGLVSRGLAEVRPVRGRVTVTLSEEGRAAASRLRQEPEWSRVAARCRLLGEHYDLPGNQLKERIYSEFPDVVDRPHRSLI